MGDGKLYCHAQLKKRKIMARALYNLCKKIGTVMEYSITGSEVAELISCKRQDVYNSASYGQMIRKEFYVEVVDRPLS